MRCALRPPGRIVPVDEYRQSSAIRFAGDVVDGVVRFIPGYQSRMGGGCYLCAMTALYDFCSLDNTECMYQTCMGNVCRWGLKEMKERRKQKDRRSYGKPQSGGCGHSRFPDRRLNSISAEWIPLGLVHSHPLTQRVFEATRRVFTKN